MVKTIKETVCNHCKKKIKGKAKLVDSENKSEISSDVEMSETATRNLPALARSKRAVSEHAQEHAPGFSPAVLDKIEVYHFHGTNQCFSCRTVGAFAEKTVNTYYKELLDSGKMTFASINVELPENMDLAVKYGVSGSSLWIGTYIRREFHKEENTNVWYKVNDEADYLSYLKSVLDKRLSGDLS